jgi:hypothetical protein
MTDNGMKRLIKKQIAFFERAGATKGTGLKCPECDSTNHGGHGAMLQIAGKQPW